MATMSLRWISPLHPCSRKIRDGEGPQFLHAVTYRFKGHVSVDVAAYRDGQEVARALEGDPLLRFEAQIAKRDAERIREEAQAEVKAALEAATSAPWPDRNAAYTDIQDTGTGRWT